MAQLVLEADYLVLELDDLSFAVNQLGFFIFEVEGLSVDQFV